MSTKQNKLLRSSILFLVPFVPKGMVISFVMTGFKWGAGTKLSKSGMLIAMHISSRV